MKPFEAGEQKREADIAAESIVQISSQPLTPATPVKKYSVLAGTAFLLISSSGYGSMPVLVKLAYAYGATVPTVLVMRFVLGAIILWSWLLVTRRIKRVPRRSVLNMMLLGGFMVANSSTFFLALSLLPVATVALIGSITPAVVTTAAALLLKETLTPGKIVALVLAVGGGIVIIGLEGATMSGANLYGIILTLVNIAVFTAYILLTSRLAQNVPYDFGAAIVLGTTALIYLVYTLPTSNFTPPAQPEAWLFICTIGIFSTALSMLTYLAGVTILGASRAIIMINIEPAISVILAALVLGESIYAQHIIGGILIMAALVLLNLGSIPVLNRNAKPKDVV